MGIGIQNIFMHVQINAITEIIFSAFSIAMGGLVFNRWR